MIINANTYALGSKSNSHVTRIFFVRRACLHEGGGPQVDVLTRLCGVTRLSI